MKEKAFPGIKGRRRWRGKDSRGDKRVRVSLGGDQEGEQVLWSALKSSLRGGRSSMKTGRGGSLVWEDQGGGAVRMRDKGKSR